MTDDNKKKPGGDKVLNLDRFRATKGAKPQETAASPVAPTSILGMRHREFSVLLTCDDEFLASGNGSATLMEHFGRIHNRLSEMIYDVLNARKLTLTFDETRRRDAARGFVELAAHLAVSREVEGKGKATITLSMVGVAEDDNGAGVLSNKHEVLLVFVVEAVKAVRTETGTADLCVTDPSDKDSEIDVEATAHFAVVELTGVAVKGDLVW